MESPVSPIVNGKCLSRIAQRNFAHLLIPYRRFDTKLKKWTILKPMLHARYGYTAAVMNGCIYVTGGFKSKGTGKPNLVQRYDPTKNEWTKVASVMDPRFQGVLVEWKGLLYAIGVNKAIERYDRTRNEWVNAKFIFFSISIFIHMMHSSISGSARCVRFRRCHFAGIPEITTETRWRLSTTNRNQKMWIFRSILHRGFTKFIFGRFYGEPNPIIPDYSLKIQNQSFSVRRKMRTALPLFESQFKYFRLHK